MYDFPPGSVTVCPSFSGHFQGKAVGVGFAELEELLDELLDEELLVADADWLLLVLEDDEELDPVLEDDEELEVVADMLGDIDDDELVLRLESVILDMVNELVLTEPVRVLTELVLPVTELELEELEESMGGPAEYTMAPAGWGIR
jgi:hypothetical protein